MGGMESSAHSTCFDSERSHIPVKHVRRVWDRRVVDSEVSSSLRQTSNKGKGSEALSSLSILSPKQREAQVTHTDLIEKALSVCHSHTNIFSAHRHSETPAVSSIQVSNR